MSLLTAADVIESLTGIHPPQATQVITEAVVDVRNASPGSLFIATRGQETGQIIAQAFDQGAVLALMQIDPLPETRTFNILPVEAITSELSNRDLPLCLRVDDNLAVRGCKVIAGQAVGSAQLGRAIEAGADIRRGGIRVLI